MRSGGIRARVRVADIGVDHVRIRPTIGSDRPPSCMRRFFFCDWLSSPLPPPISPPIPSPWTPEPTVVLVLLSQVVGPWSLAPAPWHMAYGRWSLAVGPWQK